MDPHETTPEARHVANVVRLLRACDVPVASAEATDAGAPARDCRRVLPYEVVVRRQARGSFLERNPQVPEGHLFPRLVVEFFLKTEGKRGPLLTPATTEMLEHEQERSALPEAEKLSRQAFLVLEKAWQLQGKKLVDLKLEFGFDAGERLQLTRTLDGGVRDVADAKQGGSLGDSTLAFHLPEQRIILWRGSSSDPTERFSRALGDLESLMSVVTCSAHKEPVAAALTLQRMVHEVADSVIIAYIGRSNGAGPTLSAMSTVPVITVPASVKDFPDDVWSSLRAPSKVPVMTVLEPENAVLAALQILSAHSPRIYARLRGEIEARMVNTILI